MRRRTLQSYFAAGRSSLVGPLADLDSLLADPIWSVSLAGKMGRPTRPAAVVDWATGCILWQGADNGGRHGMYNGHPVYRSYFVYFRGPISAGLELHHTCGNPRCVNPLHLTPLTRLAHKGTKLNLESARAVRSLANEGIPARQIAAIYDISPNHVRLVAKGRCWPEAALPIAA